MAKPEKLTVVLDRETRATIAEWALEDGRPVSNLLRRIVDKACAERRQQQQQAA